MNWMLTGRADQLHGVFTDLAAVDEYLSKQQETQTQGVLSRVWWQFAGKDELAGYRDIDSLPLYYLRVIP